MNNGKRDVLIIIPAYNEEKNIGKVLSELKETIDGDKADILVINDASTDKTGDVVRSFGCKMITNIFNLGYGNGLWAGYKYATEKGYRYVIQMDADGQHDVCNIPEIMKTLESEGEDGRKPDIVLGSRFMKGHRTFKTSVVKKIAYEIFRSMLYLGTGKRIYDPTTGLQGLSREAFTFYSGYKNFDDKYPDANMIMQMLLLGFKVVEIPAVMHFRTEGISMHSGFKPIIYMFRMFFSMCAVWMRIKIFGIRK